jgi:hypothetical protein
MPNIEKPTAPPQINACNSLFSILEISILFILAFWIVNGIATYNIENNIMTYAMKVWSYRKLATDF